MAGNVFEINGNLALKSHDEAGNGRSVKKVSGAREDFVSFNAGFIPRGEKRISPVFGKARYNHLRLLGNGSVKSGADNLRIVRPDRPRLTPNRDAVKDCDWGGETHPISICREKAGLSRSALREVSRQKNLTSDDPSLCSAKEVAESIFVYQGLRKNNLNPSHEREHIFPALFSGVGSGGAVALTGIFSSFAGKVVVTLFFLVLIFLAFGFGVSLVNTFDGFEAGKAVTSSFLLSGSEVRLC